MSALCLGGRTQTHDSESFLSPGLHVPKRASASELGCSTSAVSDCGQLWFPAASCHPLSLCGLAQLSPAHPGAAFHQVQHQCHTAECPCLFKQLSKERQSTCPSWRALGRLGRPDLPDPCRDCKLSVPEEPVCLAKSTEGLHGDWQNKLADPRGQGLSPPYPLSYHSLPGPPQWEPGHQP